MESENENEGTIEGGRFVPCSLQIKKVMTKSVSFQFIMDIETRTNKWNIRYWGRPGLAPRYNPPFPCVPSSPIRHKSKNVLFFILLPCLDLERLSNAKYRSRPRIVPYYTPMLSIKCPQTASLFLTSKEKGSVTVREWIFKSLDGTTNWRGLYSKDLRKAILRG